MTIDLAFIVGLHVEENKRNNDWLLSPYGQAESEIVLKNIQEMVAELAEEKGVSLP